MLKSKHMHTLFLKKTSSFSEKLRCHPSWSKESSFFTRRQLPLNAPQFPHNNRTYQIFLSFVAQGNFLSPRYLLEIANWLLWKNRIWRFCLDTHHKTFQNLKKNFFNSPNLWLKWINLEYVLGLFNISRCLGISYHPFGQTSPQFWPFSNCHKHNHSEDYFWLILDLWPRLSSGRKYKGKKWR